MEALASCSMSPSAVLVRRKHQHHSRRRRRERGGMVVLPSKSVDRPAFQSNPFSVSLFHAGRIGIRSRSGIRLCCSGGGGSEGDNEEEEDDEEVVVDRALGMDGSIPNNANELVKRVSSRAYDIRSKLKNTINSSSYDGTIISILPDSILSQISVVAIFFSAGIKSLERRSKISLCIDPKGESVVYHENPPESQVVSPINRSSVFNFNSNSIFTNFKQSINSIGHFGFAVKSKQSLGCSSLIEGSPNLTQQALELSFVCLLRISEMESLLVFFHNFECI